MSLEYLNNLEPPAASYALLAGFHHWGGAAWESTAWDADAAYSAYLCMKGENLRGR